MLSRSTRSTKLLMKAFRPALATSSLYSKPMFHMADYKPKLDHTGQGKAFVETRASTTEEVSADFGLGHYMTNVYKSTGGGILASLGIAKLLAMAGLASSPLMFLGGAAISLGGIFTFNKSVPQPVVKVVDGIKIPYAQQPPGRWYSYAAIFAGTGMSIAPLIAIADMVNPVIIPMSIALTAFTFGGISAYAYKRPLGEFNKFGGVLTGGVFGLIGMSLVSMGSYLIMGPNPLSYALMRVEPYLALGIFSGLLAYDTHQAIERYKLGDFDHLSASVAIYLDVVNLLTSFIRILLNFFNNE